MVKKIFLIISILSLTFWVVSSAFSQMPNFTDDQKNKLKDLSFQMRQENSKLRMDLRKNSMSLFYSFMKYNLDDNVIKSSQSNIEQAQLALLNQYLNTQIKVRSIVTEQQFNAFSKMMNPPKHFNEHNEKFGRIFFEKELLKKLQDRIDNKKLINSLEANLEHREKLWKKLDRDTSKLTKLYADYSLDEQDARNLIQSIHRTQTEIAKLNLSRQRLFRAYLSESEFNKIKGLLAPPQFRPFGFGGPRK